MILDLDHISVSSGNFSESKKFLKSIGYETKFMEENIPNLSIKFSLLHDNNHNKFHTIALLNSDNNISIELVDHGKIFSSQSYIIPIFNSFPSDLMSNNNEKSSEIGIIKKMKLMNLPFILSNTNNATNFQFKSFVLMTNDIEKSKKFWQLLGFKISKTTTTFTILDFNTLFNKNKCEIYLYFTDVYQENYLDNSGFNCITFLSNNPKNDRKVFLDNGFFTTNIEQLTVNNKILEIFFAKGPSNELVEIISIKLN